MKNSFFLILVSCILFSCGSDVSEQLDEKLQADSAIVKAVIPKGEVTYVIRMLGVEAQPANTNEGRVAEHFIKSELDRSEVVTVELFRGVRKPEKFQKDGFKRFLGNLFTDRGNLNDSIIKHGYATVYKKK